jgi:hypothetical protein
MIDVVVGTDTYGRVKAVGKTAIVTKFSMLQMLPVGPLQSYYVWGPATTKTSGIPLLAQVQQVKMRGFPLARVNRTSVVFAYFRAVFAALVLAGFIVTFSGFVFSRDGKPMDDHALMINQFAEACLVTGVVGGILTYLIPTTGRRERAIRTYCSEMLGACIDPAQVAPEVTAAIREALPPPDNPDRVSGTRSRADHVQELILTRCDAAANAGRDLEAKTDDLLDQLRHFDRGNT